MNLKVWFLETRPNFLLLTPVCTITGIATSLYLAFPFNWLHFTLAFVGALLAHISTNVLNDYFDYKSGIDLRTKRTPFSGGSGILTSGLLEPKRVYLFGIACLFLVILIGIYFVFIYKLSMLPIVVLGALLVFSYTPYITKLPGITEILGPGLGFGLMVLGIFFTQTGVYSMTAIVVSFIVGLLVANLLLLNEFPDVEADKSTGRKHLPIILGRKKAAKVYCSITGLAYISIIVGVLVGTLPLLGLLSLVTLPLGIKVMKGVLNYHSKIDFLIPYLATNVFVVLLVPFLLSIGLIISVYV
ncbi:MAG: prenyltransferase [Candidatus Methylarchaceae archaeon HK01B]|nr:prenyltransferase [Candidatus Methylarchaceae archaeon HK02M1]MCP8318601.1 prenyltransferase [Candidatus Methylarchaceae archaeon HK01B]